MENTYTQSTANHLASRLPAANVSSSERLFTLLAGAAHMHFGRFLIALVIGSIPVGVLLAWAGDRAGHSSALLLVLTLIPAGLWCGYLLVMGSRTRRAPSDQGGSPLAIAAESTSGR